MRAIPRPVALAVVGGLAALGCRESGAAAPTVSHGAPPAGVEVLLVASGSPCGPASASMGSIQASVSDGMDALEQRFAELGFGTVERFDDPDAEYVLDSIRSAGSSPLFIVYSGHGTLYREEHLPRHHERNSAAELDRCAPERGSRCVSALCMGEQRLTLDEMVASVPSSTPMAVIVADACASAHVDVRGAKTDVSVISVSPHTVSMPRTLNSLTYMANALTRLGLREVEGDCDGRMNDLEFFFWLRKELDSLVREEAQAGGQSSAQGSKRPQGSADPLWEQPQPKLRRQVSGAGIFLPSAGTNQACNAARVQELEAAQAGVTAQHSDPPVVEVRGVVRPDTPLNWEATPLDFRRLIPVPCESSVGQCFRWE